MGTETLTLLDIHRNYHSQVVKLNNPLMGTETLSANI